MESSADFCHPSPATGVHSAIAMARPLHEPAFSFPFDILHVSDTHFRASPRANKPHLDEWSRLLMDVKDRIESGEFKPELIALPAT